MANDDIYGSKAKYEKFKENLLELAKPLKTKEEHEEDKTKPTTKKYYCKNPDNLEYFKKLFLTFESKDLSYVRRIRLLQVFKVIVNETDKNLKDLVRQDIDQIVSFANQTFNAKTSADFRRDIKYIWKIILPDNDEKGRPDETVSPYVVRHLKSTIDKSRQETRQDRLSYEEFEKIVTFFGDKPCLQFYLMEALESLARPQELLWRKIRDLELHDNYAIIRLSDHGKEGTGLLKCIDSYAYLTDWLNVHPDRTNKNAYLFLNENKRQLSPFVVNKHLRKACKQLGITKDITCYSLKRNGVTFLRLQGRSDLEIQHTARWTSTRQLKTYDKSEQSDSIKKELIERGLIPDDGSVKGIQPKTKPCFYCRELNKITSVTCSKCNRPLDREKIAELEREKEIKALNDFMSIPQVQQLFKTVMKLQKKVDKLS